MNINILFIFFIASGGKFFIFNLMVMDEGIFHLKQNRNIFQTFEQKVEVFVHRKVNSRAMFFILLILLLRLKHFELLEMSSDECSWLQF
jgi:hypothetical protein